MSFSELASEATAVLLDPEVSAAQAIGQGCLPGKIPFVVAVESTGYGGSATARQSQVLPGWSLEKAKRMGASMVKLLVYYHPDSAYRQVRSKLSSRIWVKKACAWIWV